MSQNKQIPYKNGDVIMDSVQFLKSKNKAIKMSNINRVYEYDERYNEFKQTEIAAYVYNTSKDNELFDVSNLSMEQIQSLLKNKEIVQQLPISAVISDIKISDNGSTLYSVKLRNDISIKIRLGDIAGLNAALFKNKTYGLESIAKKHRYIKINIKNESNKFALDLLSSQNDMFLKDCDFVQKPSAIIPAQGQQTFYIIGQRYGEDHEFFACLAETGVAGCLQYTLNDAQTKKIIEKRLTIAFRTFDQTNECENLKIPSVGCWILDSNQVNAHKLEELCNNLMHSSNNDSPKKINVVACFVEAHNSCEASFQIVDA
eukprot:248210_1